MRRGENSRSVKAMAESAGARAELACGANQPKKQREIFHDKSSKMETTPRRLRGGFRLRNARDYDSCTCTAQSDPTPINPAATGAAGPEETAQTGRRKNHAAGIRTERMGATGKRRDTHKSCPASASAPGGRISFRNFFQHSPGGKSNTDARHRTFG